MSDNKVKWEKDTYCNYKVEVSNYEFRIGKDGKPYLQIFQNDDTVGFQSLFFEFKTQKAAKETAETIIKNMVKS